MIGRLIIEVEATIVPEVTKSSPDIETLGFTQDIRHSSGIARHHIDRFCHPLDRKRKIARAYLLDLNHPDRPAI